MNISRYLPHRTLDDLLALVRDELPGLSPDKEAEVVARLASALVVASRLERIEAQIEGLTIKSSAS